MQGRVGYNGVSESHLTFARNIMRVNRSGACLPERFCISTEHAMEEHQRPAQKRDAMARDVQQASFPLPHKEPSRLAI